jgi:hypothetical protein
VRVAALVLAAFVAACGVGGRGAAARDSSAPSAPVEVWPVNAGRAGLRVNVRWLLSPNRRAILVVHDPVSVEADPIPDGFLYANEGSGTAVQVDGVWDVAPSPDWTRLAFGRAYVLNARERDTMPAEEWRRVEAQLPEDVADRRPDRLRRELEAHAFPASGMALMLGLGLTQVLFLDRLGPGRTVAPTGPTHSLYGWRVRWTPSGDTLGVGTAPRTGSDDDPPGRWVLVRPRLWAAYRDSLGTTADTSRFARLAWTEGPTMDFGSPVEVGGRYELPVEGGRIEARGGVIHLTTRGRGGRSVERIVGPGMPLAATATGMFIAALVARPDAKRHEMRGQLVVYHIAPR